MLKKNTRTAHFPSCIMSPTRNRRRHKREQIVNTAVDDKCRFLRCALKLATTLSSDCVRVLLRDGERDLHRCPVRSTGAEDATDRDFNSVRNRQTKKETNYKTMIIATTTFSSIPTNSPGIKQRLIYVKPLIVLDLNGILCHRIRERQTENLIIESPKSKSRYRPSIGRIANTEIVPRSDLVNFLQFLHQHFAIAVWTSATAKTAKALVNMLFPDEIKKRLVFVWHRGCCNLLRRSEINDDGKRKKKKRRRNRSKDRSDPADNQCNVQRDTTEESSAMQSSNNYDQDLLAVKSLSKVWSNYPIWDETNTLLLDDSPDKCPRLFRGNAAHPPSLCGTETMCEEMDEQNSGCEKDDTSSDKTKDRLSLFVSDDEANEKLQYEFFVLLAQHMSYPITRIVGETLDGTVSSPGKNLTEFLGEHARVYNMRCEDS